MALADYLQGEKLSHQWMDGVENGGYIPVDVGGTADPTVLCKILKQEKPATDFTGGAAFGTVVQDATFYVWDNLDVGMEPQPGDKLSYLSEGWIIQSVETRLEGYFVIEARKEAS